MPPGCVWSDEGQLWDGPAERVKQLSAKCGSRDRIYSNTLLFLLPNQRGLNRLRKELREVAALEAIKRDYGSQLDPEQLEDLKTKLAKQKETVSEVLGGAYPHVARVEGQKVAVSDMTEIGNSAANHLQAVWRQVTDDEEWVLRKVGTVTLQKAGMAPTEGGIRVRDAVEAFLRYTDKPLVATAEAVTQGLSQACGDRLIAIGRGTSPQNLQTKRCGEFVALDRAEDGVWIVPPIPAEAPATRATGSDIAPSVSASGGPTGLIQGESSSLAADISTRGSTTTQADADQRVRSVHIAGPVPLESWTDIFRCFVNPASRLKLKSLQLGIEIKLLARDDQPLDANDPTLKTMREAAQQLRLEIVEVTNP